MTQISLSEPQEHFIIKLPDGFWASVAEDPDGQGTYEVWVHEDEQGYRSAWNLPTFESAVRNIMDVVWKGAMPFHP